jgi:hypothetical protein
MVVTTTIPNRGQFKNIGGKDIAGVTWAERPRGPIATKSTLEVCTDDGSVYRWSRFDDSEPWTFEHRQRPDGTCDSAKRQLPSSVAHLVAVSPDVLY